MDNKIFLGKYRVTPEEMGAVGEVTDSPLAYQAEAIDSGKKMIVEVVPGEPLKAGARERLEADAMAAMKLTHVNIPALHDFGVEENHLIYVTEEIEGTPAEEWVNTHGPMPVGPVLRIAAQVVSALAAAAFHRINHAAINPRNLLLVPGQTAEGEWPLVKVLHFVGVAPKLPEADVDVAAFDKSLHYASPEQIQKGEVDFRSELYSLGATMWFLLTGAPPLVTPAVTDAPVAKTGVAGEKIDAVPKKVRRLLTQMLAVDPEARPSDPVMFYRQLRDCLDQVERRETIARRFGVPLFSPSGLPSRRRLPVKALALAALLLALASVAAVVVSKHLRHERVARAEEPIGKPIGVPEASASVTPVTANTAIASSTAPAVTTLPQATPLPSVESAMVASNRPVEVTPAPPAITSETSKLPSGPAHVVADNAAASPAVTEAPEVALRKETDAQVVASAKAKAGAVAQQTAPKTAMHEVRRAEPPPPDEGSESAAPKTTAPDSEPRVTEKSPAKKTERTTKPKSQAERKDYRPERPPESARPRGARILGVTPEGWRILELPSGKIVIVPPQRSSP